METRVLVQTICCMMVGLGTVTQALEILPEAPCCADVAALTTQIADLEAVVQRLQNRLRATTTSVATLQQDVATLHTDMAQVKTDITTVESTTLHVAVAVSETNDDVMTLSQSITSLESDVDVIQTDITNLHTSFGDLQTDFTDIDMRVTYLDYNVTAFGADLDLSVQNAIDLDGRVTYSEGMLTTLATLATELSDNHDNTVAMVNQATDDIADVNNTVTETLADIDALQTDVTSLTTSVATVGGDVSTLAVDLIALQTGVITQIQADVSDAQSQLTDHEGRVLALEGQITDGDYTVGFTARASVSAAYAKDDVVIFDDEVSDIGGDNYDVTGGMFTCPYSGLYYFTVTVTGDNATGAMVALRVGGNTTFYVKADVTSAADINSTGAGSVVYECSAGQTAYVTAEDNTTHVYGASLSSFSGFLIEKYDIL